MNIKKQKILIIGSTGSIGRNTLEVVSKLSGISVVGIAFSTNVSEALKQIHKFNIKKVCAFDDNARNKIRDFIPSGVKLFPSGIEGLTRIVEESDADILMLSLNGAIGIFPLISAIGRIKRICIANKEPIVIAGKIIKRLSLERKTEIIPVDSEPSAIFQILGGYDVSNVKKIYLTASGGPFYNYSGSFDDITPAQAIKHPRWNMGKKISVDSATLMNKGLELIEMRNLFDVEPSKIEVVIHPQSVIHSCVEFIDGSIMAQMSYPDMKLPIQLSITWPKRLVSSARKLDIFEFSKLEFFRPDLRRFRCLYLAIECAKKGGLYPTILNAANEVAVDMFLKKHIKFTHIPKIIEGVLEMWNNGVKDIDKISIEDIIETDSWAREKARIIVGNIRG